MERPMHAILVPTDFSRNSATAVQHALLIANEFNLRVDLIYVAEKPLLERFLNEEEVKAVGAKDMQEIFKHFMDRDVALPDLDTDQVQVHFEYRQGNVIQEIVRYADQEEHVMIVTGSQGGGSDNWDRFWVGGTAQKIVRKMELPVLIVPPDTPCQPIKKIAFATNYRPEDKEVLREVIGFADQIGAEVSAVHIRLEKVERDPSSHQHFEEFFREALDTGKLRLVELKADNVESGLRQYIEENGTSILAMVKTQHNLFHRLADNSLTLRIALHSEIPSLIFKE